MERERNHIYCIYKNGKKTFYPKMADDIILASDLPSGGSYSGVGTYDHAEIIQLVSQLSQRTNMPIPDLVRAFGNYLFDDFTVRFSQFINEHVSAFDFLKSVHSYIHIEVRKLHPKADFPLLTYEEPSENVLEIHYRSTKPIGTSRRDSANRDWKTLDLASDGIDQSGASICGTGQIGGRRRITGTVRHGSRSGARAGDAASADARARDSGFDGTDRGAKRDCRATDYFVGGGIKRWAFS